MITYTFMTYTSCHYMHIAPSNWSQKETVRSRIVVANWRISLESCIAAAGNSSLDLVLFNMWMLLTQPGSASLCHYR